MMDNILRCIEHAGVKLYAILHTLLGWVVAGLLFLADYGTKTIPADLGVIE